MTAVFELVDLLRLPGGGGVTAAVFSLPDLDAPPEPPPPEPVPEPEEDRAAAEAEARAALWEAAEAAGRAAGEAAGRAAAEQEAAARGAAALVAIAAALEGAASAAATAAAEAAGDLARLLLSALGAALPAAAARLGPESATGLAARLAPLLEAEVAVTLHVPPGCGSATAQLADPRLRIAEDPSLPPGGARAAWRGGGAEFSPEAARAAVAALLDSFGLHPLTERN
ncbi:hypothetical protein JMJ55_24435 [Belnapia sp. T6]|uniref:Flagellar assembly protein FliH n=1 Tax=Belnapia mucosa TaxID=2804532 RepID=A0ABS1VA00_9PROT|nr:hypothetical protein [Belnapia mucosa]MBL6458490.1 hypothetical protein [Belnapia mucosa]